MTRARFFVFFTFVLAPAAMVGASSGYEDAFWYVVLVGFLFWLGFTAYDFLCDVGGWLNRRREITINVYDHEQENIVDAEIISEEENYKRKRWWEEGVDNGVEQ